MKPQKDKEKKFDIQERIVDFCNRILDIADMIPNAKTADVIRTQLVRSSTSIGANMEEADGSITRPDFVNKVALARKEAKETRFWMRLISDRYIPKKDLEDDLQEILEIIKILSAIIIKSKENKTVD